MGSIPPGQSKARHDGFDRLADTRVAVVQSVTENRMLSLTHGLHDLVTFDVCSLVHLLLGFSKQSCCHWMDRVSEVRLKPQRSQRCPKFRVRMEPMSSEQFPPRPISIIHRRET